jgi:hypothetical protein
MFWICFCLLLIVLCDNISSAMTSKCEHFSSCFCNKENNEEQLRKQDAECDICFLSQDGTQIAPGLVQVFSRGKKVEYILFKAHRFACPWHIDLARTILYYYVTVTTFFYSFYLAA